LHLFIQQANEFQVDNFQLLTSQFETLKWQLYSLVSSVTFRSSLQANSTHTSPMTFIASQTIINVTFFVVHFFSFFKHQEKLLKR
jgi:hypothetical protein